MVSSSKTCKLLKSISRLKAFEMLCLFVAPHLTGFFLKLFVWIVEVPIIGSLIISVLKKQNKMTQLLRNTVIPEAPMFKPEFPPQEPETGVVVVDEDGKPEDRVGVALKCLPNYDPATCLFETV